MRPAFSKVLSETEIKQIHESSLVILESTGTCIHNTEILDRLESAGASVERSAKTAKFPSSMVENQLKKAPGTIQLFSRNDAPPLEIGKGITHAVNGFDATFILDYDSGERRPISREEVGTFAWMADQLEGISIVGIQGLPQDVPQQKAEAYAVLELLQNTAKHIIIAPDTGHMAEVVYKMIKIATEREDIGKEPVVSCHISPSAPQEWTPSASEILLKTVSSGVPFYILPAPMAGATSPVTLAGHLVQHNTQVLSGLIIAQVLSEGFPVVYCNAHALFNMREGNPIIATPETLLLRHAGAQMARYYGIPSHSIGFDADAHIVDQQCIWEKAMSAMACVHAGIDVMVNLGMFSTGLTVSYESLLLDHEIFSMLRRFQRGIEVTKEHLAVDVIEKIGTWGSFLAEEHTLRHFKKENWFPEISNRKLFEKWSEEGQKDAHRAAHKNVQGLLEKKRILSIDQITSGMLNRIIEEA